MENIVISKDKTQIIKGFAILFMILHHSLIKEFYLDPPALLSSFVAIRLQIGMKMCVGIFTFVVGYGSFYAKDVDIHYIKNHIWRLLKQYWLILFITIALVVIKKGGVDYQDVVLNLFGLKHSFNLGNWYIYFYIYAMLILPLVAKILKSKELIKTILVVSVAGISSYFVPRDTIVGEVVKSCLEWTPLLVIGFVSAKTQILSKLSTYINNVYLWLIIVLLAVAIRCGISGIIGIKTDVISVPVFVISIAAIFTGREHSIIGKTLSVLGTNSTYMWFIHCLFFSSATNAIFQSWSIWPNNIIILYISVTVVTLLLSIFLKNIISYISLKKTK